MVQYHGRITRAGKKRSYAMGGEFPDTKVGETKKKTIRERSGSIKEKMVYAQYANVMFKNGAKPKKCKIVSMVSNPVSADLTRRKVITRGAVIEVDDGGKNFKAKVTSRPGQVGAISAVEQ
ncbi:MAG: hypothetical protein MSIBF_02670 [Candidatus Altiarchaeales archaeon IMC4]|nr:MAG: hypothetical protein MSIBF_02670 [Candidatus Altiarchaeales archaeon IMC4]